MKKILLSLCFAACLGGSFAQRPRQGAGTPNPEAAYVKEHYTKTQQYIPMRDGVKLFCTIYTPKDQSQKYPIIMTRTPYSVGPYDASAYKASLGQDTSLTHEGFIFVFEDVRGRYMSEGEFVNVRPQINNKPKAMTKAMDQASSLSPQPSPNINTSGVPPIDESTDTYDTIDWLVKNLPNNNGRVGIEGISYPGFYSTASLPNAHPALKAVSPQAPVTEWFKGDDFHHKGVFFEMDAFAFLTGFGVPRPKPVPQYLNGIKHGYKDNYKFYLEMGALPNFKKKYLGDSVKFWDDMMNHPNYDSFWQGMNILPHLVNIKPAVLTVGGFFDAEDAYGAQEVYKAIEKQNPSTTKNMLVLGPWFHGGWERGEGQYFGDQDFGSATSIYFQRNIQLPFFNYYLKDKGTMDLPEASIFISGSNQWHRFNEWPPKNTTEKKLYLHANGKLSFQAEKTKASSFDEYVSDPATPVPYQDGIQQQRTREYMLDDQRFASRRPDVKTYQTDVLTEDITLTGPVIADLFSSTTGTDADYVVKLIDVFPDDYPNPTSAAVTYTKNPIMAGYQMLVRGEIFRGRFRNSYAKPEAFVPGKVTEIKYDLPDVGHTFRKGHRMMIQIQNTWFPLADRNPQKFVDINKAKDSDFQKATIRIYHDDAAQSNIKVTVLNN